MIDKLFYYVSDSYDPYENMALEYVLTMTADDQTAIVFLWQNDQTIVVGRNQNVWKECYVNQIQRDGVRIARRYSGGGAVYHDLGNLNFSFCMKTENYNIDQQITAVIDAVSAFGADAKSSGRNDIVLGDGRKFSGNAFLEKDDCACHHGTLMIQTDLDSVERYLHVSKEKLASKSVPSVRARVVNLKDVCPKISVEAVKRQLINSVETVYGLTAKPLKKEAIDYSFVRAQANKLASWQWIYGRKTTFSHCMHHKFLWGETDFAFSVKNGMIEEVKIYSDALAYAFILQCENALCGCAYHAEKMYKRLTDCAGSDPSLLAKAKDMWLVFAQNI